MIHSLGEQSTIIKIFPHIHYFNEIIGVYFFKNLFSQLQFWI